MAHLNCQYLTYSSNNPKRTTPVPTATARIRVFKMSFSSICTPNLSCCLHAIFAKGLFKNMTNIPKATWIMYTHMESVIHRPYNLSPCKKHKSTKGVSLWIINSVIFLIRPKPPDILIILSFSFTYQNVWNSWPAAELPTSRSRWAHARKTSEASKAKTAWL